MHHSAHTFSLRRMILAAALAVAGILVILLLYLSGSSPSAPGSDPLFYPTYSDPTRPAIGGSGNNGARKKNGGNNRQNDADPSLLDKTTFTGTGSNPDRHLNFELDEQAVMDDDAALLRANLPEGRLNEIAGYPLPFDAFLAPINPVGGANSFRNKKARVNLQLDGGAGAAAADDHAEPARGGGGGADADQGNKKSSSNKAALSTCADATNCLQCLFRAQSPLSCVWLAARGACVTARAFAKDMRSSVDAETHFCPAILHRGLPNTINVIHVAIRKGGPEALVQLHLALAYWGFRTHLDSRRSKKQKGGALVPFFRDVYSAEFGRVSSPAAAAAGEDNGFRGHFADYEAWQRSGKEGDTLVATETWACRNDRTESGPAFVFGASADELDFSVRSLLSEPVELRRNGVRYAQWHLTVWPRRSRSGCTIVAHTRYIASTYMKTPLLALLFPYVSPHIVKLALKRSANEYEAIKARAYHPPLIMYDGDVKSLSASALASPAKGLEFTVKRASGYTPDKLYEEYGKATVCIDWELPGGERFIYESALFGCCPIVDRSLNGLDAEDFALPRYLRVSPSGRDSQLLAQRLHEKVDAHHNNHPELAAVNAGAPRTISNRVIPTLAQAIGFCADGVKRRETMRALRPFRASILRQRVRFHKHVRRYFSNSVHVVTAVATAAEFEAYVAQFLLATLAHVPFATVEFLLTKEAAAAASRVQAQLRRLMEHSYLAAVLWTVCRPPSGAGDALDGATFLAQVLSQGSQFVTTNKKRAAYVAFVPIDRIISHRGFVHYLGSLLSLSDSDWMHQQEQQSQSKAAAPPPYQESKVVHGIAGEGFVFVDANSLARLNQDRKASTCAEVGLLIAATASTSGGKSATSSLAHRWFEAMRCEFSVEAYQSIAAAGGDANNNNNAASAMLEPRALKGVAEVEAELVLSAEKRLSQKQALVVSAKGASGIPAVTLEFLCDHALFAELFRAKCGLGGAESGGETEAGQ